MNIQSSLSLDKFLDIAKEHNEPLWALDVRQQGAAALRTLPNPTSKEEIWRCTNPNSFRFFNRDLPFNIVECEPTFKWLNGEDKEPSVSCDDICDSFTQALVKEMGESNESNENDHSELRKALFADAHHQKESSSALNAFLRSGGAYVHVPENFNEDTPILVEHTVKGCKNSKQDENCLFLPHSLVVAESNSNTTVIERFASNDEKLEVDSVIELKVKKYATLQYVMLYDWGNETNSLTRLHIHLSKGSVLKLLFVGLGGNITKVMTASDLVGTESDSQLYGVVYADKNRHFDIDTLQKHHVQASSSNVLVNSAVTDNASTVFSGNIFVDPKAKGTDAYQKNCNLLLSEKAKAKSMPKLEILADDVKCTHGASFSSYDRDQEFYLMSRGMTQADSRRLLISGFFQAVVDKIENQKALDYLSHIMQSHMEESLAQA